MAKRNVNGNPPSQGGSAGSNPVGATEAAPGVKQGHELAADHLLQLHRLDVHGYVEQTIADPESEHRGHKHDQGGSQPERDRQQAQVALTLPLGKQPDLLLLDEPRANLDPRARREFLAAVRADAAATGLTKLFDEPPLSW